MSDSFFQKKRKRAGDAGGAKSRGGSTNPSPRDRGVVTSKAGPSRLRMREKARGTGNRKTRGGSDEEGNDDDDEKDDLENGGVDEMDLVHRYDNDLQESDEDEEETPAEAKVRLAKLYLEGLRNDEVDPEDADAAEADRQNIAARLQADVSSQSSHIHTFIADKLKLHSKADTSHILACRGHKLSVTSALVDSSCKALWSAGKDGRMIRWRLRDGKMMEVISKSNLGEWSNRNRKPSSSTTSGAARRKARASLIATHQTPSYAVKAMEVESMKTGLVNGRGEDYCKTLLPSEGQGHSDEIWALTLSSDGKYLVTGGKDKRICVWSVEGEETSFVKALGGHKDCITGLKFRMGSHDLFSASSDRTLKLFDVSQLSYVETFFGHQEEVASLDLLRGEVAVSAGSRDRTVRWWKVRDESQLVFRGGAKSRVRDVLEGGDLFDEEEGGSRTKRGTTAMEEWVEGSIDSVAMIDEHTFLSGGDSGTISLWSLSKKKPIFTAAVTHGYHRLETETEGVIQTPRWITSLACLPYGDLFASGSWDGRIRLWRLDANLKSFAPLHEIPADGFVNSLQLVMPSRSVLKRQGGKIVEESSWRRKGGLRGGAKKVFEMEADSAGEIDPTEGKGVVLLTAGIGQEPTRGRWLRIKEAQNGVVVVPFVIQ
ncbi:hypothetical protein CBS101457_006494 [Exobasidium rhododendri]|nr:hypothetical protein CBS101457_006494 [Exobasidium rhododendri]